MSAQMSAHAKRQARARRRVALRRPVVYLARQLVIAAIRALPAGHRLRRWAHDDPLLRIWELPDEEREELHAAVDKLARTGQIAAVLQGAEPRLPPPWSLGEMAASFQTEVQVADVGQRRKAGRPPKPQNSNDRIIALLKRHRPHDFIGRFSLRQAEDTRQWLQRRKIYKSTDAITTMVNRDKRRK